MFEILTVCTGNICRSPLAEAVLQTRLGPLGGRVRSAGTQGLDAEPMTEQARRLAEALGADAALTAAHRSAYLSEQMLVGPDLVIAMTRAHRQRVVELDPSRLRTAFTAREFARLAADASDAEILAAADAAGADARRRNRLSRRLRGAIEVIAAKRGMSAPPADPADDDVIDPFRQSWETYELSGRQLAPALDQITRVVTIAVASAL